MSHVMKFLLGAVTLSLCAPSPSSAEVPDCTLSTFPDCLRLSPDGSIPYVARLLNTSGMPYVGLTTRLIISSACSDLIECTGLNPIVYTADTDSEGDVEFDPKVGGCCSRSGAAEFEVDPGAVTCISYPSVGTPDADSDGAVGLADFTLFQAAFLQTNSCFDLAGCDNEVGLADFTIFQSKFLVSCP